MNDTTITVQGWLGSDPHLRLAGGTPVANFRVACTPRRRDRATGEWVDQPTQWYGVSAWRTLAEHCGRSLRRGDPVILHGRLTQRTYVNKGGVEVTAIEIDATSIGHDLNRGISVFSKTTGATARAAAEGPQDAPRPSPQPATPPSWAVPGAAPGAAPDATPDADRPAAAAPAAGPVPAPEREEGAVEAA